MNEIASLRDFLAHALALEREAAARYQALGAQMESHHNYAVAETFLRLAREEADHAERIVRAAPDVTTAGMPKWEYRWTGFEESPEVTPFARAHPPLMTPYAALVIALENEERAVAFYERVARSSPNDEVRALAAEYAAEERRHAEHIRLGLARAERPSAGFDHDLDPPRTGD